ncbi:MAG: HDOD domain-containing protein [Ignavibacteria bacterium]|nr:HDOD domain-containing protein [Ignavibacteria bacterium]
MLNSIIQKQLESLKQLPTMPAIATAVLQTMENSDVNGVVIAKLIERDAALTARVLAVANSPFYGFSRKISTVELALVLLGLSTVKEIIISLILQGIFAKIQSSILDINVFWRYSVFCGSTSRFLARKLGYRIAGEAFVAGLMHDIGILIEAQYLTKEFVEIQHLQQKYGLSFVEAELEVLQCTHCDIGAWFAEKWQLPAQLIESLYFHHSSNLKEKEILTHLADGTPMQESAYYLEQRIEQPLTALVALSELFALELGFKQWAGEVETTSQLYLPNPLVEHLTSLQFNDPANSLQDQLLNEFETAVEFTRM